MKGMFEMKRIIAVLMIFAFVFTLFACQGADDSGGDNGDTTNQEEPYDSSDDGNGDSGDMDDDSSDDPVDSNGAQDNVDEEPTEPAEAQIEDTIEIEGMEEMITLNLYEEDGGIFRTYIPYNFISEKTSTEDGEVYGFYANYGDVKIEALYVKVYFFSEDTKEEQVVGDQDNSFSAVLAGMEMVDENEKLYSWAAKEFQSSGEPVYAMVGMHSGQYYVMFLNYYGEYTEGFVPRMNKIIEHFYWTDTQEYLAQ